ncbi:MULTISPECIES: hypothetical protein [Streptomyces]|uniref:hypothetical protein n=1 Tax=Streptomyces TaxID=1883 RepID=UPI000CD55B35|nr:MULTISPECIES: hypothetical protein [Streptomyces]
MSTRPETRFRFEPARLLLGVGLLVIAVAFVARAAGELDVQLRYIALALPVTLALTALASVATYVFRRRPD